QRARHRVRRAAPDAEVRRGLRSTAQTGPEPRLLSTCRRSVERHVLAPRRSRRANRPAVDAGRLHADEETPVETSVSRQNGPVTGIAIEIHGADIPPQSPRRLAEIG